MSVHKQSMPLSFLASGAIAKGKAVKIGADNKHVSVASAATDKQIGISMGEVSTAEDAIEVSMPGGGAKGLAGGTIAAGDFLTSDANGALIVTTTPGNRYIAMAMEDAVVNDLFSVEVVAGLI